MYEVKTVGLAEAEVASKAIIEEASKTGVPVVVAIVAPDGYLVHLARMDKAPWHLVYMATRKAYSAARMRSDTRKSGEYIKKQEWIDTGSSVSDDICIVPGGVNISEPSDSDNVGPLRSSYGGIGISGRKADEDEALAFIGLKALQEYLWPKS